MAITLAHLTLHASILIWF